MDVKFLLFLVITSEMVLFISAMGKARKRENTRTNPGGESSNPRLAPPPGANNPCNNRGDAILLEPGTNGQLPVAIKHIFCGEVEGKTAQGFHVIPQGVQLDRTQTDLDLGYARVIKLRGAVHGKRTPVSDGVQIRHGNEYVTKERSGHEHFHFFPNILSKDELVSLFRGAQQACLRNTGDGHATVLATIKAKNLNFICFVIYVQKLAKYNSQRAITTAYAVDKSKCQGGGICQHDHQL